MKRMKCKNSTNIEQLYDFIEKEDPDLLPAFLTLIEVCFHSEEHGFKEL